MAEHPYKMVKTLLRKIVTTSSSSPSIRLKATALYQLAGKIPDDEFNKELRKILDSSFYCPANDEKVERTLDPRGIEEA